MAYCTRLEWAEEPHIAPCAVGEPADFRGLKIIAVYSDGNTVPVDVIIKMFHETNMQETGAERPAQVVYEKKRLPVTIPLKDAALLRIEAVPASLLTFHEGETFDRSRAVVTAYYSDGTSRVIDNYKIAPHLPLTTEDKIITFRYGRCTSDLPLTVLAKDASMPSSDTIDVPRDIQTDDSAKEIPSNPPVSAPSMSDPIASNQPQTQPQMSAQLPVLTQLPAQAPAPVPPEKTVVAVSVAKKPNHQKYLAGDTLVDLKGGRLDIIYSDGTAGQIDMIADGPVYIDSEKPGAGSISFTCLGSPVSFPIDVLEPKITKLSVSKMPAKLNYFEGEELDLSGLVLEAVYNDGSTRIIRGLQSNGLIVNMGHAEEGVTLSYEGEPFTVKIKVKKKNIPVTALFAELAQEPDKIKYIENDPDGLDLTGAALLVQMSDGRRIQVPVTKDMVDPVDLSKPGRCLLNIRYKGFSIPCSVFVVSKILERVELRSGLKKTEYVEGEDIDLRGVILDACYNNGEKAPVSDYEVSPKTASVSDLAVTFRYNGMEVSAPVIVHPLQATLLDWVRQPVKTVYYSHEKSFSCDGGILRIKRNNGTEEETALTPEMVTGFRTDRIGPLPLRISCAGKVIPFTVTVRERTLLGLRVVHKPRLEYTEGEEFDPKGLVVEAVYSGETAEIVGVTYLPYGPLSLDTSSVMLVYQDKAVVMPVTVSKPKQPEHHPIIPIHLSPDETLPLPAPAKETASVPAFPASAPKVTAEQEAPAPVSAPDVPVGEPEIRPEEGKQQESSADILFEDAAEDEESVGQAADEKPEGVFNPGSCT
ncbi:MAG: bacterial Ig-like domain-containing protein [Oscillospiraceae bacterium]|nr:bacterial Ig-like domain-containing protein [Oscillospiraceae bacterium]